MRFRVTPSAAATQCAACPCGRVDHGQRVGGSRPRRFPLVGGNGGGAQTAAPASYVPHRRAARAQAAGQRAGLPAGRRGGKGRGEPPHAAAHGDTGTLGAVSGGAAHTNDMGIEGRATHGQRCTHHGQHPQACAWAAVGAGPGAPRGGPSPPGRGGCAPCRPDRAAGGAAPPNLARGRSGWWWRMGGGGVRVSGACGGGVPCGVGRRPTSVGAARRSGQQRGRTGRPASVARGLG